METLLAALIFICVAGILRYTLEARMWRDHEVDKE